MIDSQLVSVNLDIVIGNSERNRNRLLISNKRIKCLRVDKIIQWILQDCRKMNWSNIFQRSKDINDSHAWCYI
ncbi:hypothetical protein EA472_21780 [Natrarchaeobius oligotrophus]|uniref:Uncharacterized protein n=1 Tax=Natrarchaeobius chitinivorans TaxID=1679083 RepID=A0A3N6M4A8_NATCH|nr:hypothetical protein EA472_21780 [Natrarchaeobius chitinivorans]